MGRELIKRKIVIPLLSLVKQGVAPEKLALSLAFGVVIACMPMLGVTTILCVAVATLFRLNHLAIQLANYAAYPLQVLLLLPFLKLGEKIFGEQSAQISVAQIVAAYRLSFVDASRMYFTIGLRGLVAWLIVSPLGVAFVYLLLLPLLRRFAKRFCNTATVMQVRSGRQT